MKILEKEIGLRNETRTLQQARAALKKEEYAKQAAPLAETQKKLAKRVADVTRKIREIQNEKLKFPKEIALLTRVEQVMHEATGILARPDTGPEAIAAETEIIELLLAAKRMKPGGGGGGGSSPGGGGGGTTNQSALALIGSGAERNAKTVVRHVGQSTGVSGRELPAEYRSGLDAYFGALEGSRLPKSRPSQKKNTESKESVK